MRYRSMYKNKLAKKAGVSLKTFSRWLQSDKAYFQQQGVPTTTRLLPPHIVRYLCEKYDIDVE